MSSCKHNVFYVMELSSIVNRIVDNAVQYSDTSKDGYRITCYSCGYDRTFKSADKLPQWVTKRIDVESISDDEYVPSWRI